jgi:hypothetical protein
MASSLLSEVFSLFWVMNSCEPDYADSNYLQEHWGVYTSLAFVVPPFCRLLLLWRRPITPKLRRCYLSMLFVALASGVFHSYVSYPTQVIDMTAILIAELCFAEAVSLSFSGYYEVFLALSYFSILFTPILTGLNIGLLFLQFSLFTIQKFQVIPVTSLRVTAVISLVSMVGAVLCLPLDLLCNSPLLFHAYWHLLIAVYCFSGAIAIELLYNLKVVKAD